MPNTLPTSADTLSLLDDLKLDHPNTARLDVLTKQGIRQFEKRTGWTPFLSASSDSTRTFDPTEGRTLTLDAGLLSLTSLSVAGTSFTQGKEFWLKPNNIQPYQYILFLHRVHGFPQSISITGRWGYSTTVPEDAWLCMQRMAALPILSEVITRTTGGLIKWEEGGVSEEYGEQPLLGVFNEWRTYVDDVVDLYTRVTVGA